MIACLGDLLLDIMITVRNRSDGMPEGIYLRPGGSAANVAAWATSCGAEATWVGVVGSDTAGEFLLADLRRCGVSCAANTLSGFETGVVISRLGARGERHMHSARLAGSRLKREHIPPTLLTSAAAVHVTGYAMNTSEGFEAVDWALRLAAKAGAFTSVDPSNRSVVEVVGRERFIHFLEAAEVKAVFANKAEAQAITDSSGSRAAANALSHHVPFAIVKDGARGSYLSSSSYTHFTPAIRTAAIDTTGAGDAFAGGWLATYLRTGDSKHASLAGTEVAASAITSIGARPVARVPSS